MSEKQGYDRSKDKILFKEAIQNEKRFLNIEIYSYDGGEPKIRIKPVNRNSNPNAKENQKWVNQKAISAITLIEAEKLIIGLEKAVSILKKK